jgi:hypothetical protein
MSTTAEAAAHIFLTAARFHDLVAQGILIARVIREAIEAGLSVRPGAALRATTR